MKESCVQSGDIRVRRFMTQDGTEKWKQLAKLASKETDARELSRIVEELVRPLDLKEKKRADFQ
jgi:hypothetical protein